MTVTIIESSNFPTFQEAQAAKDQIIWDQLELITVEEILREWMSDLSYRTRINYQSGAQVLVKVGLLNPLMSLRAFSLVNHDSIVHRIKLLPDMLETTRQARAALYISFTRSLSRRFPGVFKKAMPSREGTGKTFFRVHDQVVTEAMNQSQWMTFFSALENINSRDCLIAKVTLQGGKRIREVLSLTVDQIDWEKREITFAQSKTRGREKKTIITYPESIMKALKALLAERIEDKKKENSEEESKSKKKEKLVFISKKGNPLTLNQVANTFARAGKKAGIPFKVTPHVLRASAVTYLKQQGFSDSDIQKITGHASSEMVNAYDKSSRADNATKKVCLIT